MDEIDKLLAEIDAKPQPTPVQVNKPTKSTSSDIDRLLSEVKTDYQQKERELEQQKTKEIEKQAITWLRNLNPMSSEGLWFEDFAKKYSSKIVAAIDYLRSLEHNT